jgi:CRISPR/Cas system CSM-associated protein Csm3 (group 7 of RAMP superfamily)
MHKKTVNEMRLAFSVCPRGPLLIKSGRESGGDPTLLDMNFVRLHHTGLGRETVYLPGSSLKGTLRSYCEKIARTVSEDANRWPPLSCDPLGDAPQRGHNSYSCSKYFDKAFEKERDSNNPESAQKFARSCAICRIFGNTAVAAHLYVSDGYPWDPDTKEDAQLKLWKAANTTEQRDGVAIDRVSGAVAVGPFNLEVVTQGEFFSELTLKNFQLWQVGLLGIALRDLLRERVPIGFGKSRGLGRVTVTYRSLEIRYPGQFKAQKNGHDLSVELHGVTTFLDSESVSSYGYRTEEPLALPGGVRVIEGGDSGYVSVGCSDTSAIEGMLKTCVPCWRDFVTDWRRSPT